MRCSGGASAQSGVIGRTAFPPLAQKRPGTPLPCEVYTNLITSHKPVLASFYQTLLGCVPVPPERDFAGPALDGERAFAPPRARVYPCASSSTTMDMYRFPTKDLNPCSRRSRRSENVDILV